MEKIKSQLNCLIMVLMLGLAAGYSIAIPAPPNLKRVIGSFANAPGKLREMNGIEDVVVILLLFGACFLIRCARTVLWGQETSVVVTTVLQY